jgi:pyruvate kinase
MNRQAVSPERLLPAVIHDPTPAGHIRLPTLNSDSSNTTPLTQPELEKLLQQLFRLRSEMLELETSVLTGGTQTHLDHTASAANLMHYLALRRHDIRHLQSQLASIGLSSLGRTEAHVLSALDAVMEVIHRLLGRKITYLSSETAPKLNEGAAFLQKNTEALLGPAPTERRVRIMVTMPPEAATNYNLVRDLVAQGMDCMRINCAHDDPEAWAGMIRNLRRAEQETKKTCKVAMDLAGPKLRTGPIEPGPRVLKYRPKRDASGHVVAPARIWLTPNSHPEVPPASADAVVPVPATWLAELKSGDRIRFTDARGASRLMTVSGVHGDSRWADARRTAYVFEGMTLEARGTTTNSGESQGVRSARVGPIPATEQTLRLKLGDHLVLTKSLEPGRSAETHGKHKEIRPARIGVSLAEFFDAVKPGEAIWLDDGKIGGVIREVTPERATVEITHARPAGEKLGAEKGINLPESDLGLSSLTKEDLEALHFIVKNADIVSFSFVRREGDVRDLQVRLAELGGENLGIILKIETREGFEQLPHLLLAAMQSRAVGVMIARGDLAVECGYQRLAEVQEEILWICEAAHMPVIWATQVLESLAKTGIPSRSEITDAAMGERAECVMLNKGPYIVTTVKVLDDILRRMQSHQEKKRSMLRKLHLADAFRTGD